MDAPAGQLIEAAGAVLGKGMLDDAAFLLKGEARRGKCRRPCDPGRLDRGKAWRLAQQTGDKAA